MQFIVMGYDGQDEEAPARRQACRERHLKGISSMKASGHFLYAGAILDDAGKMAGSVVICDFPSRTELDAWLANEVYVTGGVWQDIQVKPFAVAATFLNS